VTVVPLPSAAGRPDLPSRPEPVDKVVKVLEGLLEKAMSGEVRAIAVAYVAGGDTIPMARHVFAWNDDEHIGYPMATAVSCMHHDYYRGKVEQQE
jgi:hypothetical protein